MQDRTWTLTTADGHTYKSLSQLDAMHAIDRVMRGAAAFEQESREVSSEQRSFDHELPLAA